MLSIVICSLNNELTEQLKTNIRETAGVDTEIIVIDNSRNEYSLCAAYNKGIGLSKGYIICFLHEDIVFRTRNWGAVIQKILEDKEIGLAGVAGAYYYPLAPVGWFHSHELEVNIIQHYKYSHKVPQEIRLSKFPGQPLTDVAVLDGLFLAGRKEVITQYSFDEKLPGGYHGYDVDISLQVRQSYKLKATKDILIEHLSEGRQTDDWYRSMKKIAAKWKKNLPVFSISYSKEEKTNLKLGSLTTFYKNSFGVNRPWTERFFLSLWLSVKQNLVVAVIKKIFR
jgi:hypothetical protein